MASAPLDQYRSAPPQGSTVDAVVVGAGIAGLSTARELLERGRSITVLERRDRVGGRLHSPRLGRGDGRVDLGATWFWPGESRVTALVERLGIAVHDQHLVGDALYQASTGVQRLDGNPLDVPSWRFTDGAASLAETLATTLPADVVHLGTTVEAIRAGGAPATAPAGGGAEVGDVGPLTVHHGDCAVTAEHVVLALPPALAVADIDLQPALPEPVAGLAAATPVWMGATTKVVARYEQPFWRHRGLSGSAVSHVGPMRELHDMSGPDGDPAVLFGFAPGLTGAPTPDEAAIRRQLGDLFGPDGAEPIELLIADWRHERATSPDGVEALGAYQTYGHELYRRPALGGRLHWASTETSPVAPGHIEGALAAAERAVAAIDTDLADRPRPQGATTP
ncbi:MAG: NAD(P)/FAD-dependent oxidoreductase [Actinomycetota bacterium]